MSPILNYKKSISNIAWKYQDNEEVFNLLKKNKFKYIEVAPIELIDDWSNINWKKIKSFKNLIDKYNLKVCSMQSIFYKTDYLLYRDLKECISHFKKIENICNLIECDYVVFGAPRLRKFPSDMKKEEAYSKINDFFEKIKTDIRIGIEAIPEIYNTNIFNNYIEVNDFVAKSSSSLNIHFDIGSAIFYGFEKSIKIDKNKITNIHLSLPYLDSLTGKEKFIKMLMKENFLNEKFVSIEMKKSSMKSIKNAIKVFDSGNNLK